MVIVAVPTPIDDHRIPDLGPVRGASTTVGRNLAPGACVVFESTVYPGVTEEVCVPILQRESGLELGTGFSVGYSPERINPGDKVHTVDKIVKVVSGSDAPTLELLARVYGRIVPAGIHRASSIRVAEAAKVIENTQRDINIALMNELAMIFHRMGIDTTEVLEAAGTKWNFLPFRPGLVGGHCIGVDPYYLTFKAEALGYHPEMILAGRRINDNMGKYVAERVVKMLIGAGKQVRNARVAVLGLTFKEDVPDLRNTRVIDIITELADYGVQAAVHDPERHARGHLLPVCKSQQVIEAYAHRAVRVLPDQQLLAEGIESQRRRRLHRLAARAGTAEQEKDHWLEAHTMSLRAGGEIHSAEIHRVRLGVDRLLDAPFRLGKIVPALERDYSRFLHRI
jgi:UDP-N-acetyl-D-galactosamine dehydrogenase